MWSVLSGMFFFFVPCKFRKLLHCVCRYQYHTGIGCHTAVYLNMTRVWRKIFRWVSGIYINNTKIYREEVVLWLQKAHFDIWVNTDNTSWLLRESEMTSFTIYKFLGYSLMLWLSPVYCVYSIIEPMGGIVSVSQWFNSDTSLQPTKMCTEFQQCGGKGER